MNKTHTAAHMEGQQLYTDLVKANERIRLLEAVYEAAKRHEQGPRSSTSILRLQDAIAAVEAQDDTDEKGQ